MMVPTVLRGFNEACGSWNTICMFLRTSRKALPPMRVMS